MDLGCRASACIIEQVGVVIRYTDLTIYHSLRAYLLQEIGRRDLALADHPLRNLRPDGFRKIGEQKILENAAGATHRRRILLIASVQNAIRRGAEPGGVRAVQPQRSRQDDPVFAAFEDALAIA